MILSLLLTGLSALLVPHAFAALSPGDVISTVGSGLPDLGDFPTMMSTIKENIQPLLPIMAVILITYAGIRMVVSQEDNATETAKNTITLVVAGLILALLVEPFVSAFGGGVNGNAQVANDEVVGVANWATTIALVVAIISTILSAIQALFSPDSDEGVGNIRKTVIGIVSGILILGLRVALATVFSKGGSPEALLSPVFTFVKYIIGFVTTLSVAIIVYAGFLLITSGNNEENATKAKGVIIRTLIGLLVIGFSYALVTIIIEKFS